MTKFANSVSIKNPANRWVRLVVLVFLVASVLGGCVEEGGYNCSDFPLDDGTTAQQWLEDHPADRSGLDGNGDGVACQNNPSQ